MKNYTFQELHAIYYKYCNLSYNYFTKYEKILDFVNLPDWEHIRSGYRPSEEVGVDRTWCILDFKEWIAKHNINPINKLLVTSDDAEEYYLKYNYKFVADYEVNKILYDLHTLDLPEKDFDFMLFSQTLEHLHNPQLAMQQITKHIKPNGYVFTSVPTVNIPHMTPIHFQGFTPMGLIMLFISNGFEPIEVGQFGNEKYSNCLFKDGRTNYRYVIDENNLIKNDPNKPMHCWILAKKN